VPRAGNKQVGVWSNPVCVTVPAGVKMAGSAHCADRTSQQEAVANKRKAFGKKRAAETVRFV